MPSTPCPPQTGPSRRAARLRAGIALAGAATLGTAPVALSAPAVLGTVTAASAVGAAALAPSAQALAEDELTLVDTAGIIDPAQLGRDLADVEFYDPTSVVVYTERGADMDHLDDDAASQEFNGRVLERARTQNPEWLSADGQKWADGLMVFAIDPDNRMTGVYVGEDRLLDLGEQATVRGRANEHARAARWTDAVVAAVEEAADTINRPWYLEPGIWIAGGTTVLGAGALGGAFVLGRRRRRDRAVEDREAARRHLTNVTMDMEATEVNAATVPTDGPHGARLMERFRGFREQSLTLTQELQELDALPEKRLHSKALGSRLEALRGSAERLDHLDDAIAAAATFLNRHPGWEDAWDLQTAALREDLDRLDRGWDEGEPMEESMGAEQSLRSFAAQARTELERLGARLQTEDVTPSAALDSLDELRATLSRRLEAHAEEQIELYAESDSEREALRSSMDSARRDTRRTTGSILETVHEPGFYWTVASYTSGYSAGRRSVESARASASSSSGTGYGSSGGSFSGTGSSGRF